MSTDHTDPGPLEGLIPPEMLLTMNGGEPAIVCLRVEKLDAALAAAHDMGLPVALSPDVVEAHDFRPPPRLGRVRPRRGGGPRPVGREREASRASISGSTGRPRSLAGPWSTGNPLY